ncbi:hypothetical protein A1Q2_01308 [Trichosporon asahii var. asahii CBS 8904]|uniref:Frataxin n=2 Tax=Trichosporon asahii var. asahii TaxID=189963 RepID=K1WU39_TRIAC|nr:hypothetical protein A1Q1_04736 [Trichosporon asahii var. asahii CBS 2479]EJT46665.1 hypothetical protein A1Q1_04736 [Trichosporon asahii var. asahii CBS 2479]EKD04424.1 hypothetical protein A1Q2_01308 [Trichosporon asahii var. asahii CBS 8904]
MSFRLGARYLAQVPRLAGSAVTRVAFTAPRARRTALPALAAHARFVSSTPHGDPGVDPSIAVRDMTDEEYHDVADEDMDQLHEALEDLVENFSKDWEVEYSQPPNHQIWVSSPVSGPSRYSMSPDGIWVHHRRKGIQLGALLEKELREFLKETGAGEEWDGVRLK